MGAQFDIIIAQGNVKYQLFYQNQMFELCKKVEVYNFENHYYYYGGRSFNPELSQKIGLHLLKAQPLTSISSPNHPSHSKSTKKGIKLSNSIQSISQASNQQQECSRPHSQRIHRSYSLHQSQSHQLPTFNNYQIKRQPQTSPNSYIVYNFHPNRVSCPVAENIQRRDRIQRIQTKNKPFSVALNKEYVVQVEPSPFLRKQTSSISQSLNKNLSETRPPVSSKIQTCCTYQAIASNHLISKCQPQVLNINFSELRQSHENSSSKLISISKSVSSLQETIRERDYQRMESQNQSNSKGSHVFQISLSNIFSKQEITNQLEKEKEKQKQKQKQKQKKLVKQKETTTTPMKKLSLWQDSDRHTIQSRFSRQFENTQDFADLKVQQSIIEQDDLKQNFIILQSKQIRKKDYILSQAIDKDIDLAVSIKEFLTNDMKLIAQQLEVYSIFQKNPTEQMGVLQLYKIQLTQGSHFLIKQPYTQPLYFRLKSSQQGHEILRERTKKIALNLLTFLESYKFYPTRKLTTHQFVVCLDEIKLHDLGIFRHIESGKGPISINEVISGIDI